MENNKIYVKDLIDFFAFEQVTGDKKSLKRGIKVPDINRPGLELTGFTQKSVWSRLIILGQKECAYIQTLNEEIQKNRFDQLTGKSTPCIIVTHGETVPQTLIEIASEKNFPVFKTDQPTNLTVVDIIGFLDEHLAHFDNVHGVLMSIFGKGILIIGESGVGKSEIALDLINRGHVLVADDRVDCYRVHNNIVGKAPNLLKHYIEIRGVGILDVVQMFGAKAYLDEIHVEYIIDLKPIDSDAQFDRLGVEDTSLEIMGVSIPKATLPVGEGRNMSVLIESAVTKYLIKQMGVDPMDKFYDSLHKTIKQEEH